MNKTFQQGDVNIIYEAYLNSHNPVGFLATPVSVIDRVYGERPALAFETYRDRLASVILDPNGFIIAEPGIYQHTIDANGIAWITDQETWFLSPGRQLHYRSRWGHGTERGVYAIPQTKSNAEWYYTGKCLYPTNKASIDGVSYHVVPGVMVIFMGVELWIDSDFAYVEPLNHFLAQRRVITENHLMVMEPAEGDRGNAEETLEGFLGMVNAEPDLVEVVQKCDFNYYTQNRIEELVGIEVSEHLYSAEAMIKLGHYDLIKETYDER